MSAHPTRRPASHRQLRLANRRGALYQARRRVRHVVAMLRRWRALPAQAGRPACGTLEGWLAARAAHWRAAYARELAEAWVTYRRAFRALAHERTVP